MKFKFVEGSEQLSQHFYDALIELCQKYTKIGLLLPGGSNITAAADAINRLKETDKQKLDIILSDERYGPVGHPDSNEKQYQDAGLNLRNLNYHSLLNNLSQEDTLRNAIEAYRSLFDNNEVIFAFLGIGADGHIAGVLPSTPGVNSNNSVVMYNSEPFIRITPSLATIFRIDRVVVGAIGDNKLDALRALKSNTENTTSTPALVLNNINDVTIFTDQKEII